MEISRRMLQQKFEEAKGSSLDEKFLNIAKELSANSTCIREDRKTAAVIVRDGRIIASGFNGAPQGITTCKEKGYCDRKRRGIQSGEKLEMCFACHGEQAALMNAARDGVAVESAIMYSIKRPCINCLKLIISSGIKEIVYLEDNYDNEIVSEILKETDVVVRKFSAEE